MKNILLILVSVLSISVAISEPQNLKVGVIIPLSGPLTAMGNAFQKGVLLYKSEQNPKIDFIIEDGKYEGRDTLSAFHKLRDINKVDLIIVWGNTPSSSVAPVAESLKMPTLTVSANPDAKDRKYVVSFGYKMEALINVVREYLVKRGSSNIGAVSIDIGNALQGVETLKNQLQGKLFAQTISNTETDFKSLIAKLKSNNIDGILLFLLPDQALTFIKQANQFKYKPVLVGGDVFADENFLDQSLKEDSDLGFVYGAVDDSFLSKLKIAYGTKSFFFETATGYTLAALAERTAEHLQNKEDIIQELKSTQLSNLPITELKLINDTEYGNHFESRTKIYSDEQKSSEQLVN